MKNENIKSMITRTFVVFALAAVPFSSVFSAPDDASRRAAEIRAENDLNQARLELERAREELKKAAAELRSAAAEQKRDRHKSFSYFSHDSDRAFLGVIVDDEKTENGTGVLILGITPGGGAEEAGLEDGDLIVAINGAELKRQGKNGASPMKALRTNMDKVKAGEVVTVTVLRNGKRLSKKVTTSAPEDPLVDKEKMKHWIDEGERHIQEFEFDFDEHVPSPEALMPAMRKAFSFIGGPDIRGLQFAELDPQLAWYFKTDSGVLVVKAPKDGPLALMSGDVLQSINDKKVSQPHDAIERLVELPENTEVTLKVVRRGKTEVLKIKMPEPNSWAPMHGKERIIIRKAPPPPNPPSP